jgi:hypothetical protein
VATDADIIAFCKRTMGDTTVDVELTDDHYADAVEAAKDWYAMLMGQYKTTLISLAAGTTEYAVPTDCEYVVEVVTDAADSSLSWGFPDIPVNLATLMPTMGSGSRYLSDLTLTLQYLEMARRVTARDQDWQYDPVRRVLAVTPPDGGASRARVWYMTSAVDVSLLKRYEYGLVRDFAKAHCMEVLSNIRSKYAEMPGAAGGFTMNGDLLSSNAAELKRGLTEQLRAMQPPFGPIWG